MSANHAYTGFAAAAARLAASRTSPQERRRFRRAPLVLGGRLLDAAGREHDCRTADVSPGDMRVATPVELDVGSRVVIYLDTFGRVSGRVARRCSEQDYAVIFEASPHKREKLAETLTWMINRERLGLEDARTAPRDGTHATHIELEDGKSIDGAVLDFSLSGVTIRTAAPRPEIGAWVRIGGVHGRVARYTETGFAVDFESRGGQRG